MWEGKERAQHWPWWGSVSQMMMVSHGQQAFHPTVEELHPHLPVLSRGNLGRFSVHVQPQLGGRERECIASRAVPKSRWGQAQRQKSLGLSKIASGSATWMSDTAAVLPRFGALDWSYLPTWAKERWGQNCLQHSGHERDVMSWKKGAKIALLFKRICSAFSFACHL